MSLLLLCDEVEELIKLHGKDASLLRKLRHAMQSREDIRTVLASTIRLWSLADHEEDTSPFLHGFTPPLYIERFSDDEARSLIEQSHLDPAQRPKFADGIVESIREHCDNHPYLVQLVCKRYFEIGGLDEAIQQVATDRMVSYFFSVDFEMLSTDESELIRIIARQPEITSDSIQEECSLAADVLEDSLRRLENLGFIRGGKERRFELANYFFRRWLQSMHQQLAPAADTATPIPVFEAGQSTPDSGHDRSSGGFIAELKRRNIFRVGIAYAVVAWLLLQIADILFQILELPNWTAKLLLAFLAIGLPIALLLAWAFELTPEGIKKESDVQRSSVATHRPDRRFNWIMVALVAIAVLIYAWDKFL